MSLSYKIISLLVSYLLGSIPSAVWIGQYFYNIDVREHGSGNSGATNTFRVLGKKAGIPVLLIDIFKGFAAVQLVAFSDYKPTSEAFVSFQIVLGISALMGHIFPVFAGFRGGKGIATLLGVILAIHPIAAFFSMLVFIVVLLLSRYVSLSSILAGLSFPFIILLVFKTNNTSLVIFAFSIAALVLITHQKNIERLLRNEESRANLIPKKK